MAILWWHEEWTSPQKKRILTKTLQTSYKFVNKAPHSQNYNLARQPATSRACFPFSVPQTFCGVSFGLKFLPSGSSREERVWLCNVSVHRSQGHDTARVLSAIKRWPHCNTQNHFTGFMFPQLCSQLLPILKHSSLILSPRWSNPPQNGFTFQRQKSRSCRLTLSGMSRSHSAPMKSFTTAGKFCSTAMWVADAFCCGKKTLCLGRAHLMASKRLCCACTVHSKTAARLDSGGTWDISP